VVEQTRRNEEFVLFYYLRFRLVFTREALSAFVTFVFLITSSPVLSFLVPSPLYFKFASLLFLAMYQLLSMESHKFILMFDNDLNGKAFELKRR
jgi:hypothetical protein